MNASVAKHLLVIEDELAMRQALAASFRRAGWTVDTAAGLMEAVNRFGSGPFPVVITDMRMPDGTGLDVLQFLRTSAPQTAVILLTAYGSVPDAVCAMRQGACDYLVKPVSFERLQQAVMRALHAEAAVSGAAAVGGHDLRVGVPLRQAERLLLEATLSATGGNRTQAAAMLGVSVRTIRNKIRMYGLPPAKKCIKRQCMERSI